jgi:OOP family OmpA-OmpF porin
MALRGDVRHLISFDDTHHNLSYALGFTYHWGGARAVPAARAEAPREPAEVVTREPERRVEPKKEVCVYLDVYFDFDRSEIKPRYENDLEKIADFMKANPDIQATIRGYTDYIGTEEYNQGLSERRAESIKNHLVTNFGIDAERISTVGLGEVQPLATNETAFGRQLNRRASEVICTFQIVFN